MDLFYPLAAIAITNLVNPQDPLMESVMTTHGVVSHVIGFFRASLTGSDYPQSSRMFPVSWKIAMTLANMSTSPSSCEILRKTGALGLLAEALDVDRDPRTQKYCLLTLWRLLASPCGDQLSSIVRTPQIKF